MELDTGRRIRMHNSDCLVGMSRIETGTVDLVLCDLPYGTTECPWDRVIPFGPLWEQYRRVLKPRGALVLFAAQPFATELINSARKLFRYDLVWEKGMAVGHINANRMPMRSHELVLVFYQRLPKYHPQGLVPLKKPIVHRADPKRAGMSTAEWERPACSGSQITRALSCTSPAGGGGCTPPRSRWSCWSIWCAPTPIRTTWCWTTAWAAAAPPWRPCGRAGALLGFETDPGYFDIARRRVAEQLQAAE